MQRVLLHSRTGNRVTMVIGALECVAGVALFVKAVAVLLGAGGILQLLIPVVALGAAVGGAVLFDIGRRGLGLSPMSPRLRSDVSGVPGRGVPAR